MPDPPPPRWLSVKSLKQQRLERAKAIIQQYPEQTRSEVANHMAEAMGITLSTAYAYLRELAKDYVQTSAETTTNPKGEADGSKSEQEAAQFLGGS